MKIIKGGGVTSVQGFQANGLCCGIKNSGKPDLALIYSDQLANCAAVFTINSIKAAPILVSQKHVRNHKAQAFITNSGNANCFTGSFGLLYAERTTSVIAKLLKISQKYVLVASTGIIGKALPFRKILKSANALVYGLSSRGGKKAARAILTTDKVTKEVAVRFQLNNKKITIGACAKGSGMIEPNMATMLAFVTTDLAIQPRLLKKALKHAVSKTFNLITVDGCMSTNDMVAIMANGKAANKIIQKDGPEFQNFCVALHYVCLELAKMIVLDGEGATKFVEIRVSRAKNNSQAEEVAKAVANSNLVKTAAFGSNPNWGRVAAAVGSLGLKVDENTLKIKFSSFSKRHIKIFIDLNLGSHNTCVFTSDLSLEYVRINGEYT